MHIQRLRYGRTVLVGSISNNLRPHRPGPAARVLGKEQYPVNRRFCYRVDLRLSESRVWWGVQWIDRFRHYRCEREQSFRFEHLSSKLGEWIRHEYCDLCLHKQSRRHDNRSRHAWERLLRSHGWTRILTNNYEPGRGYDCRV